MEKEDLSILALSVGSLALLLVVLNRSLPLSQAQEQPAKAAANFYDLGLFPNVYRKYLVTPDITPEPVMLPVRYPARAGHELSCLIENGYEPLFRPRPDLYAWMDAPPSEEA